MTKTASEVGFCINDANADAIASHLIDRLVDDACAGETMLNRLYRGREVYSLSPGEKQELVRLSKRFEYMALTALEILAAQRSQHLEAAE